MTLLRILHDSSSLRDAGPASFFPRPRGHEITLIQRFRTPSFSLRRPTTTLNGPWFLRGWISCTSWTISLVPAGSLSFTFHEEEEEEEARTRGSSSRLHHEISSYLPVSLPARGTNPRLFCLAPTHFFFSFFSRPWIKRLIARDATNHRS